MNRKGTRHVGISLHQDRTHAIRHPVSKRPSRAGGRRPGLLVFRAVDLDDRGADRERDEPFIFPEITSDFQEVTIQGQITYRITDSRRTAALLNFTLGPKGTYVSEDPKKLSQRLINRVQVAMRAEVQALSLKQVLASGEPLVERVAGLLQDHPTVKTLGLELLGLSLLAVKPSPVEADASPAKGEEKSP